MTEQFLIERIQTIISNYSVEDITSCKKINMELGYSELIELHTLLTIQEQQDDKLIAAYEKEMEE